MIIATDSMSGRAIRRIRIRVAVNQPKPSPIQVLWNQAVMRSSPGGGGGPRRPAAWWRGRRRPEGDAGPPPPSLTALAHGRLRLGWSPSPSRGGSGSPSFRGLREGLAVEDLGRAALKGRRRAG